MEAEVSTGRSGRREPGRATWRSHAFGLQIESSIAVPGLPPAHSLSAARRTRLEVVSPAVIADSWPRHGVERVLEEQSTGGGPARTIDHHEHAGYRLYAHHFGLAVIAADGSRVRCAPATDGPLGWQRFLVGRVLPWAALLRGLEIFHASAVGVDGRAIAFVGPSGAGKTSLAVQMMLRGAEFLTDDVLALERAGGEVLAHPGAAIASLRPAERDAMAPARWPAVGSGAAIGEKTQVAVPRSEWPLPLGALYFLTTQREPGAGCVEAIAAPDPRLLLASIFVSSVQSPRRLRNHLEVCADLAEHVAMYSVAPVPPGGGGRVAKAIDEHLRAELQP